MRWKLLVVGLVVYGLFLGIATPATLFDAALRYGSGGRLRLAEARGSIWSGSGQLELRDAAGRNGVGKHIAWHLLPGTLPSGRLTFDIEMDYLPGHTFLTLSSAGLELGEMNIDLPATALGLAVAKLKPLDPTGDLHLHVARFSTGRDGISGSAALNWFAAGSAHSPVSPLGDYELRLDSREKTVLATLRTLKGPLKIDGQGSWDKGNTPAFQAILKIPPAYRGQLAPLLGLIASDRGEGIYELTVE